MELEDHPLYGKRKRKRQVCPNPLFLQWLTEWRDEAAEKGWKTQFVYGKAIKSLKKYPLPLATGKDCKMLEHFGDKTCKLIEGKLVEHITLYGRIVPPDLDDVPRRAPPKPTATKRPARPVASAVRSIPTIVGISDEEDCTVTPVPKKRARPRSKSGDREYVPSYRSGGYAVMLALYRDTQDPNSRGNLSRTELIQKAQPLADKSFTIPDAGSRYTAWSSMGTLIKKALVVKESNPAKYSLTEAGCELAHKLEVVGAEGPVPADQRQSAPHRDVFSLDLPSRPPYQQSDLTMADSSGLEFTYIDDAGEAVQTKDKAEVLIDVDFGIGFLTYCNYHGLLTSGKHYKLDTSRPMGVKVFAHLHDNDAPEMAVGPAAPSRLPTLHMVDDDDYQIARPNQTQVTSGHRFPLPSSTTISSASGDSDISKKVKPRVRTKANKSASIKLSAAASRPQLLPLIEDISLPLALSRMVTPLSELQGSRSQEFPGSQESIRSISSASSVSSLPCPDFILTPGNFDIILCIDNQEFYGAGKNGSKTLLPDLMKNGVNCDLRKLQVGDLLWVAREKTATVSGINAVKGRELVLDYVVERKRMDDLVHSCIDGRLPDQKFRLKHCGINHAIFLIETYGSMQHFSIAEDRIKQTITNLQVIDGFQIKRTGSTKESVVYLTVMTRYIHSYYKNKTLYATSPDDLQGEGRISDAEHRLLTFEQFNQGSVKSKALTVREMFGKQLIQLNGMSAEKAKAITDKYPTPSHMLEAYDHCLSVKDRESLLGTIKSGKAMRNLGQSLSKQIYQLYCTPNTLT